MTRRDALSFKSGKFPELPFHGVGEMLDAVGAVPGILSMWRQFSQSRVRLRVTPKLTFTMPGDLFPGVVRIDPRFDRAEPARVSASAPNRSRR